MPFGSKKGLEKRINSQWLCGWEDGTDSKSAVDTRLTVEAEIRGMQSQQHQSNVMNSLQKYSQGKMENIIWTTLLTNRHS